MVEREGGTYSHHLHTFTQRWRQSLAIGTNKNGEREEICILWESADTAPPYCLYSQRPDGCKGGSASGTAGRRTRDGMRRTARWGCISESASDAHIMPYACSGYVAVNCEKILYLQLSILADGRLLSFYISLFQHQLHLDLQLRTLNLLG